uniref:Enhancer of split region protein HLHm6 n=1 Tax=Teleopsis dalmanni TaxID=139649 RepID=G9I1M1_TELDL|nr:enhancer of split region protein HLHm6 [Teleopsis dalmanni]
MICLKNSKTSLKSFGKFKVSARNLLKKLFVQKNKYNSKNINNNNTKQKNNNVAAITTSIEIAQNEANDRLMKARASAGLEAAVVNGVDDVVDAYQVPRIMCVETSDGCFYWDNNSLQKLPADIDLQHLTYRRHSFTTTRQFH